MLSNRAYEVPKRSKAPEPAQSLDTPQWPRLELFMVFCDVELSTVFYFQQSRVAAGRPSGTLLQQLRKSPKPFVTETN